MVYGSYIYILFLWFINQRSHHWGVPPCMNCLSFCGTQGGQDFRADLWTLAIKNVWRPPAFRGFQPLIDPQGAQIRKISWFHFWFMISSRLCFAHQTQIQTCSNNQMSPNYVAKWCILYNSITVFKPVFCNSMIFYNDVVMYNCITYSGRF